MRVQICACALALACAFAARPPHIIFIVADDLGFNDVSYHGSTQIPTPAIDALASEGVRLENYHVQPVCSPSRSTFLSGRHVIHTGVYTPWQSNTNDHLNLSYSLLPTYLQNCCGYETVQVGKWHLGDNSLAALPVSRGFNASLGFWSGGQDYVSHWDVNSGGYDMMENTTIRVDLNGSWTTEIFAQHAVDTIGRFSPASDARLFMYLAFQNVHWPLMAPQSYIDRFAHTTGNNTQRQLVCAMAAFLDDGIANVTAALKRAGIYDDTLIIFTSDNGGPTHGDEGTQSNNYPLRGGKNTLFVSRAALGHLHKHSQHPIPSGGSPHSPPPFPHAHRRRAARASSASSQARASSRRATRCVRKFTRQTGCRRSCRWRRAARIFGSTRHRASRRTCLATASMCGRRCRRARPRRATGFFSKRTRPQTRCMATHSS